MKFAMPMHGRICELLPGTKLFRLSAVLFNETGSVRVDDRVVASGRAKEKVVVVATPMRLAQIWTTSPVVLFLEAV